MHRNPGAKQAGAEGGHQANTGEQRESYRIFKEQFNLDSPVLLNTRYSLSREDVSDVMSVILNQDGSVSPALRIEAQETIENWGRYAVPALVDILNSSDNIAMRALASQRLTINARKRMAGEFRKDLTTEQKAQNKLIAAEIDSFKGKYFMAGDSEDTKGTTEKPLKSFGALGTMPTKTISSTMVVKITFFLDTRFAKYWGNLSRLDFGVSHLDKRPVLEKYSVN